MRNGVETSAVKWFDWMSMKWKRHKQSLLSENTMNLAVTAFPLSAVDCFAGCSCGLAGNLGNARIVGGTEAQVIRVELISRAITNKFFTGGCLPLDNSLDQGRGREQGLYQHPMQCYPGKVFINDPQTFIP